MKKLKCVKLIQWKCFSCQQMGQLECFLNFFLILFLIFKIRRYWWFLMIRLLCMPSLLYINIHTFWFISSHRLLTGLQCFTVPFPWNNLWHWSSWHLRIEGNNVREHPNSFGYLEWSEFSLKSWRYHPDTLKTYTSGW